MLKPVFLTQNVAKRAIMIVRKMLEESMAHDLKRLHMHIVVLVPSLNDEGREYPDYPLEPVILYQASFAKVEAGPWAHKYDEIARSKALQYWHCRNNGYETTPSHLLFPNDTPFFGGVKREGIVVACSGVQPYFDKMISGMVCDLCIALARHSWEESRAKKEGRSDLMKVQVFWEEREKFKWIFVLVLGIGKANIRQILDIRAMLRRNIAVLFKMLV